MAIRKVKLAGAILALIAGALLFSAPTAADAASNAPSTATTYTYNSLKLCNPNCSKPGSWVFMQTHATYSQQQVWINGHVSCNNGGDWLVFWCGVGGGNGTATLNIGMNFGTQPGGNYVRMDIIQNGAGCYEWGHAPGPWTWSVVCEHPA